MDISLTAVFEEVPESEGGGYLAYTEELPGAITEGETLEEARENLRDAIKILLEANLGSVVFRPSYNQPMRRAPRRATGISTKTQSPPQNLLACRVTLWPVFASAVRKSAAGAGLFPIALL